MENRKAHHELLLRVLAACFRANDMRVAHVEWKLQAAKYLPEILSPEEMEQVKSVCRMFGVEELP